VPIDGFVEQIGGSDVAALRKGVALVAGLAVFAAVGTTVKISWITTTGIQRTANVLLAAGPPE
jgi:hypothetical protein